MASNLHVVVLVCNELNRHARDQPLRVGSVLSAEPSIAQSVNHRANQRLSALVSDTKRFVDIAGVYAFSFQISVFILYECIDKSLNLVERLDALPSVLTVSAKIFRCWVFELDGIENKRRPLLTDGFGMELHI